MGTHRPKPDRPLPDPNPLPLPALSATYVLHCNAPLISCTRPRCTGYLLSTFTGKPIAQEIGTSSHPPPFTPITILSQYSSAPTPARWQVYNGQRPPQWLRNRRFRNVSSVPTSSSTRSTAGRTSACMCVRDGWCSVQAVSCQSRPSVGCRLLEPVTYQL